MIILSEYQSEFQRRLLDAGPFDVQFEAIQTLCHYHCYYRFTPDSMRFFRARITEGPVKIGEYVYLIETSAAGPRTSDGRITRLIEVSIVNPQESKIVETGAAVKKAWKSIMGQAQNIEKAIHNGGRYEFQL